VMAKMEIHEINAMHIFHNADVQVIDIEHVTTVAAPSNTSETVVCHGTFLFSNGARKPGTLTFRKNIAGDPIILWKSDYAY
jgi:hypothetical protein